MRKIIIAGLLMLFTGMAAAQQGMNNDSVIKLIQAGLSEDAIVSTINASSGNYDTSQNGLQALREAGVGEKVLAAIITKVGSGRDGSTSQSAEDRLFLASMAAAQQGMNNDSVIRLVRAGLSDDMIILAINTSARDDYDMSYNGLLAMYDAGVSEKVLAAITAKSPPARPVAPASARDRKFIIGVGGSVSGEYSLYGVNAQFRIKNRFAVEGGVLSDGKANVIPASFLFMMRIGSGSTHLRPYFGGGINIYNGPSTNSWTYCDNYGCYTNYDTYNRTEFGGQVLGGAVFQFSRFSAGFDVGGYYLNGKFTAVGRPVFNIHLK